MLCLSVHLSHLSLGLAVLAIVGAIALIWRLRPLLEGMIVVLLCCLGIGLLSFGYNLAVHRQASLAPAGASFLMATLIGYALSIPVMIYALLFARRKFDGRIVAFAGFVLLAYGVNAVVCATLSGVHDRYQCRMGWLIVLAGLLLALDWSRAWRSEVVKRV